MKNTKIVNRDGKKYEIILVEGWNKPEVLEVSRVLLKHIIETNGELITYGDFCNKLSFEVPPKFVDRLFEALCYSCIESGLPPASAIVVKKDIRIPGEGFIKAYYPTIKDLADQYNKCYEVIKEVPEFKHWDILLEAMELN